MPQSPTNMNQGNTFNRCLYSATFKDFINQDVATILGTLHNNYHGQTLTTTNDAWKGEIEIMQQVLLPWEEDINAQIIFEYDIPRLGKRIDVVLLLHGLIFCLEFKVGKSREYQADIEQVMDYALDLKNFHKYSHDRIIVPILIPTRHQNYTTNFQPSIYNNQIYNPMVSGQEHLEELINNVLINANAKKSQLIKDWIISPYTPTPTIIEAARTLYENHSVQDITRHEADNVSTDKTIQSLLEIIKDSKDHNKKSICFVTGVPGAGKTLVGLDVAIKQTFKDGKIDKENGAVYLSGNGPLVAVLVEALARDNQKKCKARGEQKKKSDSVRDVREFIQIIHRYRESMLSKIKNPVENGIIKIDPDLAVKQKTAGYGEVEHVAIFDEAQRCWTHERISKYLKRGGTYGNKIKVPNFPMSEAEFLIWSLDQREDWAVIICLVGEGQEINNGEAGIQEWIKAVNSKFRHWNVFLSKHLNLTNTGYKLLQETQNIKYIESLHLAVNIRSFRTPRLSDFINNILSFNPEAKSLYQEVTNSGYKFILTRDINKAREWMRSNALGTQRTGILVTKTASRYQPLALHVVEKDDNAVHWFLEDKTDLRSSNYLEDAATEIQVQGLELDYACVVWDADVRCKQNKWTFHKLIIKKTWSPNPDWKPNTKWISEKNIENQKYMLNAYRVLLTRARQGIIICIPEGNKSLTPEGFPQDPTRAPELFDGTYQYLKTIVKEEI